MNRFDEENHQYYINDVPVPSVSQILPDVKFYCSDETLEAARQEGIDNHAMIKMYYDTGEDFGEQYIKDYVEFIQEHKGLLGDFIQCEVPLYSPSWMFGGKPDAVYTKAIIDLKRSRLNKKRLALQLGGYHMLLVENKIAIPEKWIVVWHNGTNFKSTEVYNEEALRVFKKLRRKWDIDAAVQGYMDY